MSFDKTLEWLIVYAQPFFYGAITRLPFIYFVIHMRFVFELDWNRVGLFVGSYQATRVVTSVATVFCPRIAHFVGTALGLAGNILVLASENDNMTNIIMGTVAIGFSETLAAQQTYVKKRFGSDFEALEFKLKVQYAAVMVGVVVAFSLGGVIYQYLGMKGVAWFGAAMSTGELVSTIGYFILDAFTSSEPATTENDKSTSSLDLEDLQAEDTEGGDVVKDLSEALLNTFSESGMGATSLNIILCVTFAMEAITIGYNLAVSPVYITEVFQRSTTVVGIMLAAGAACGTATAIGVALTRRGRNLMERFFDSPNSFLCSMFGISAAVMVAAVPIFPIHLIGLLLLMAFNDLAALLLNELQGSITSSKSYLILGPLGQTTRRCGNVLTAISGPILYGVFPQLPYITAGVITLTWTILLTLVIRNRNRTHAKTLTKSQSEIPESVSNFFNSTTSFSRKEILHRQIKKGRAATISIGTASVDDAPSSSTSEFEIIEFEC